MEPISMLIFGKALLGTIAVGVAVLAFLTIARVRDYLRQKRTQKSAQAMSAVMRKQLASGDYVVYAGFFEDGEFTDVEEWKARDVDAALKALPDGKTVLSGRAGV